jgi:hypothetical protein
MRVRDPAVLSGPAGPEARITEIRRPEGRDQPSEVQDTSRVQDNGSRVNPLLTDRFRLTGRF